MEADVKANADAIGAPTDRTTVSHNKAVSTTGGTAHNFQGELVVAIDNQQAGFAQATGIGAGASVVRLALLDPRDRLGRISFDGAVVTAGYNFITPQADTNYTVTGASASVTQGASSGSSRVRSVSKKRAGFSITVEEDPAWARRSFSIGSWSGSANRRTNLPACPQPPLTGGSRMCRCG